MIDMSIKTVRATFLQMVIDGEYTPQQVRDVTLNQVANQLNISGDNLAWAENNPRFFNNLKEFVAQELENNTMNTNISMIWADILVIYPNAEKRVFRRQKKVIIYLEGI